MTMTIIHDCNDVSRLDSFDKAVVFIKDNVCLVEAFIELAKDIKDMNMLSISVQVKEQ